MSTKVLRWLIFIILCIIWGTSFKLMHDSLRGLQSTQIAALRIFSAGIVFVPFCFFHLSKLPRNKIGIIVLSALFGNLIPAFMFAEAVTRLDSSLAGILNALTPICVIVIGTVFFRTKIQRQKVLGVVTGFIGLVLLTILPVLLGQEAISFKNLGYTSLVLIGTLSYGLNINIVSHYLKGVNPLHLASVGLSFMVIPTAIILAWQGFLQLDFGSPVVREAVLATACLGILASSIATWLFYVLVQKAGGLFASLVTYGIPFVALFWGFLDNEKITWVQIICLLIILLGVWLANRPAKIANDIRQP